MNPREAMRSALLAVLSVPAALKRTSSLAVLTYHAVVDAPSRIAVSPDMFRRHVAYLRGAGYRSITFAEAARALDDGRTDTRRLVCFTFDDAYRNVLENAVPVLQEAGFVATVFVPTWHVGDANRWDAVAPPAGWPILSWDEIAALSREGFEIGSHTRTHPHLPRLDDTKLIEEIAGSRRDLEDRLGIEVRTFCYPFGDHDERTRRAVRGAGYHAACTVEFGSCLPAHERTRLPRIGTAPLHTPFQFRAALGGAMELYLRARGLAAPPPGSPGE